MLAISRFVIPVGLSVALGFSLLFIALAITRDYRKRRKFADLTQHMPSAELRELFGNCMVCVARYRQARLPKPVSIRRANNALILATVIREHAALRAGHARLPTYLKSRRTVLRHADTLEIYDHS